MAKEKVQLEYVFNKVSSTILWYSISSPMGLTDWFAEKVSVNGNVFTFQWAKVQEEAQMIQSNAMSSVRFRWLNEEDADTYFEMKIGTNSLTGDTSLTIVDFSENNEKEELIDLWNNQIAMLKRKIGA